MRKNGRARKRMARRYQELVDAEISQTDRYTDLELRLQRIYRAHSAKDTRRRNRIVKRVDDAYAAALAAANTGDYAPLDKLREYFTAISDRVKKYAAPTSSTQDF